jgi:hypothetical protein
MMHVLMKIVFPGGLGTARVIITAKQGLGEGYADVFRRLVAILRVIAKNPSNPNFDQYIFESISGLILRVWPSILRALVLTTSFIGSLAERSLIQLHYSNRHSFLLLQKSCKGILIVRS